MKHMGFNGIDGFVDVPDDIKRNILANRQLARMHAGLPAPQQVLARLKELRGTVIAKFSVDHEGSDELSDVYYTRLLEMVAYQDKTVDYLCELLGKLGYEEAMEFREECWGVSKKEKSQP